MEENLPKPFRIIAYDKLITDIVAEYPNDNFLGKLENKLRALELDEDVISILITNSTEKKWPAFVNKKKSSGKPHRSENIDSIKQYKCMFKFNDKFCKISLGIY